MFNKTSISLKYTPLLARFFVFVFCLFVGVFFCIFCFCFCIIVLYKTAALDGHSKTSHKDKWWFLCMKYLIVMNFVCLSMRNSCVTNWQGRTHTSSPTTGWNQNWSCTIGPVLLTADGGAPCAHWQAMILKQE